MAGPPTLLLMHPLFMAAAVARLAKRPERDPGLPGLPPAPAGSGGETTLTHLVNDAALPDALDYEISLRGDR